MNRWILDKLESLITNGNIEAAIRELEKVESQFELPSQRRYWAALKASLVTAETLEGYRRQYFMEIAINSIKRLKQWTSSQ